MQLSELADSVSLVIKLVSSLFFRLIPPESSSALKTVMVIIFYLNAIPSPLTIVSNSHIVKDDLGVPVKIGRMAAADTDRQTPMVLAETTPVVVVVRDFRAVLGEHQMRREVLPGTIVFPVQVVI